MSKFPNLPAVLLLWLVVFATQTASAQGTGLAGDYFATTNFSGTKTTRVDTTVNFDWGTGSPGFGGLGSNNFSVRWSGQLEPRYNDTYTFYVTADDGATLWVNNRLIVSRLLAVTNAVVTGQIALKAGQRVNIMLEYFETTNNANIRLEWASTNQVREVIPQSQLYSNTLPSERGSILREHWANLPLNRRPMNGSDLKPLPTTAQAVKFEVCPPRRAGSSATRGQWAEAYSRAGKRAGGWLS